MTPDTNLAGLRARLAERLRRVIGNPGVEAKELAAFDLLMNRREFLQVSQYAAIAGLVAAGTPPTLWGREDPALAVAPADVGLTDSEMKAVTTATGLSMGTELFQEPVYAQPAISPSQPGLHAVVEGARNRPKLQSQLDASSPLEGKFLDTGYHYGPPELIQLEQDSTGDWQLVHYRHPWGVRQDGGQSDGLLAEVLMSTADGLSAPTQVLTVTSSASNAFAADGSSGAAYLVVVMDPGAPGGVWALVGRGGFTAPAGAPPPTEYPVTWSLFSGDDLGIDAGGNVLRTGRDTDLGFAGYDGSAPPAAPTERVLIYRAKTLYVLGLEDTGSGTGTVAVTAIPYPDSESWALGHFAGGTPLMMRSDPPNQGTFVAREPYTPLFTPTTTTTTLSAAAQLELRTVSWEGTGWYQDYNGEYTGAPPGAPKLGTLSEGYYLYTATDASGIPYHVHIGQFDTCVALYTLSVDRDKNKVAAVCGVWPLLGFADPGAKEPYTWATPPRTFGGGVSKFGGFRFVMTDADGRLYIIRQRRLDPDANGATPPYLSPIYGEYDESGDLYLSGYSTTKNASAPPGMPSSTYSDLEFANYATVGDSTRATATFNILLNALQAFGTDASAVSEGVWLGEGFQAVYAPSRYSWDSSHIAVTRSQSAAATSDTYAAYQMVCNPLTRAWHERLIAQQTTPADPGENESGDHYQLTLGLANTYGQTVRLSDNPDLAIEVRGDVPTTVTDTTHNFYYDIDRYTSFIAPPDPSTGQLEVVVKADTLAEILYARLVDTTTLEPSDGDSAMLRGTSSAQTYDWQAINTSAQAQQRMGTGAQTSALDLLGDASPVADPTPYVTEATLTTQMNGTNGGAPWTFKSGYSSTTPNLASHLASYLNASGTNLIIASSQGNLGASEGGQVDPLTSMTSMINGSLGAIQPSTTTFVYQTGSTAASLGYTDSSPAPGSSPQIPPGQLGSIWSGISHALHDALQWLQKAETDTINALGSATVQLVQDTDAITAVVDKDIMKAVNGVEQELTQVVSTVEEYGNVLVNVIVTIVKSSFIYAMVAEIIALISLFLHFKDMLSLRSSLQSRVDGILSGAFNPDPSNPTLNPPTVPADFSSFSLIAPYLPGGGSTSTGPSGAGAGSSPPDSVLNDVLNNPIVKKILNWIMKAVNEAIKEAANALPIRFNVDDIAIDNPLADQGDALADAFLDAVVTLLNDLLDVLVDPQAFYETILGVAGSGSNGLQPIIDQLVGDPLKSMLDAVDDVAKANGSAPLYVSQLQQLVGASGFIEIDIAPLADLLKLFDKNMGSVSGGTLTLSAADVIYLPLAIVLWTTVYMREGKVVSSVDDLDQQPAAPQGSVPGYTYWDGAHLGVDFVLSELTALSWLITATVPKDNQTDGQKQFLFVASWLASLRAINDFAYSFGSSKIGAPPSTDPEWLTVAYVAERIVAIVTRAVATLKGNMTWVNAANLADSVMYIVLDVVEGTELLLNDPSAAQIVTFVGQLMTRTQKMARTFWGYFSEDLETDYPDAVDVFAAIIFVAPLGNLVEEIALGLPTAIEAPPPPGTDNPKRQGPPPGRPRRPTTPPGLQHRGG